MIPPREIKRMIDDLKDILESGEHDIPLHPATQQKVETAVSELTELYLKTIQSLTKPKKD